MNRLERRILETERELRRAVLERDVDALDWLLADDALFVGPDGSTMDKALDIAHHRSGSVRVHRYEPQGEPFLNRVAEDAFLLSTVIDVAVTVQGQEHAGPFRYTRLYVRRPGGWRVVFAQAVLAVVE